MTLIQVLPFNAPLPAGAVSVDTTSRSRTWSRGLSPFIVGPCPLYDGRWSQNMENAWQYSKVYSTHTRPVDSITAGDFVINQPAWLAWATVGWRNPRAVRYPMGKGALPLCSQWRGRRYDYISARRDLYIPLYWRAVYETVAFARLLELARAHSHLVLRCFDSYDHLSLGMTMEDVIACPERKMGHAFVLAQMLHLYL